MNSKILTRYIAALASSTVLWCAASQYHGSDRKLGPGRSRSDPRLPHISKFKIAAS